MYEWIIIGGGIHGCTIAAHLLKTKKTSIDRVGIIDPNSSPLYEWKSRTNFIGMPYLRSPAVHHLDLNPFSLKAFGKGKGDKRVFFGPYKRPSLNLFNEHSNSIFREIELQKAWIQDIVSGVEKHKGIWAVKTENGKRFVCRNLVVATGANQKFSYPEWGRELAQQYPERAGHIFEKEKPVMKPPFLVVGGGISAAHLVIKLSKEYPGEVIQIARHQNRIHHFDSDPGWLGPKYMSSFEKINAYEQRREIITKVRNKGSVPHELANRISRLQKEGQCSFYQDEVESWEGNSSAIELTLKHTRQKTKAKTVLFATGFSSTIMEVEWLQSLIYHQKLSCAQCGFPIVNQDLSWCPHLFVAGPLAELEMGPTARNISGARKAAERIAGF
ncbi:hypothetical protein E2R51_13265 [Jeotgalibacillus sp. S-D1]|uniref:NAD(P)-binding domain-containing protein n=1 Tax=Jeotgalibacillus sp. S-D1 TaxID=2552189 RepID=UPI00105A8179|nr:NAD(P)-binding domain-containing protein [Jeotgalibacillus sp. S-D1]TDL31337.1 hypothetical protein E2R51_13265 [Jeotgalibacillus sp. S-D1]